MATIPTMKTEAASAGLDLPPDARVGIIAGGGSLPVEVAAGSAGQGYPPFIVLMEGEADRLPELCRYEHETLALEAIGSLIPLLKRHRITLLALDLAGKADASAPKP